MLPALVYCLLCSPAGAHLSPAAQIAVTEQNRAEYVELYTDWLQTKSVQAQFRAFSQGFHNVRPA